MALNPSLGNNFSGSWADPFAEDSFGNAMIPSLGFGPMGQGTLSTFNQPTTDLGPLMRRQRKEMAQYKNILRADLIETPTGYEVHCDLPGCNKNDLDIQIVDGNLVVKAERKHVHSKDTDTVHTMERSFGSVSRTIQLPQDADREKVTTDFTFGVLNVTFPKKQGVTLKRKLQIL